MLRLGLSSAALLLSFVCANIRFVIALVFFFGCFFAAEGARKLIYLFLSFLFRNSVALLDFPDQLLSLAVDYGEIVVCEVSPLFLCFSRILFPFSFQLIPVHRSLLIF